MFQNIVVVCKNRSHSVQNMCAVQICQWQFTNVKHFLHLHFKQSVSNGNAVFCNVNSFQQNKKKRQEEMSSINNGYHLISSKKKTANILSSNHKIDSLPSNAPSSEQFT